jgi:hypothetical protein
MSDFYLVDFVFLALLSRAGLYTTCFVVVIVF